MQETGAADVVIPAAISVDTGIGFAVTKGVRGLMVPDEKGERRVYVVCEPASHYYGTMTKAA